MDFESIRGILYTEEATLKKLKESRIANKELRRKLEEVQVARELELQHIAAERRFSINIRGHRKEYTERLGRKNFS